MLKEYIEKLQNKFSGDLSQFERTFLGIYKSEYSKKGIYGIMRYTTRSTDFGRSKFIRSKSHYYPGFDKELNQPYIELYRIDKPENPLFRVYPNQKIKMMDKDISNFNIRMINYLLRKLDFKPTNIKELEKSLSYK